MSGRISIHPVWAVVALQAALALWIGLPGQLSVDSIVQMYEGRTHQTISFNPPLMAVLLGVMDGLGSGPIGFVLLSQALLSAGVWLALGYTTARQWWAWMLVVLLVCNPVILAYVGIVWKDVLLAHACALLFLMLARWRQLGLKLRPRHWLFALSLMTLVVGVRQQGMLFTTVGAVWMAMQVCPARARRWLLAVVLALTPVIASNLISKTLQAPLDDPVNGTTVGFKVMMHYDLVGIVANGGQLHKSAGAAIEQEIAAIAPQYSPYRVDTLTGSLINIWSVPPVETGKLWLRSILHSPKAYMAHRVNHFSMLLGVGDMAQCLFVHSGVAGPIQHPLVQRELTSVLGLTPGAQHATPVVMMAAEQLLHTPVAMHGAYALLLGFLCIALWRRRLYVELSLALSTLVLLASYLVLGIACDFRYAYTLTVVASLLAAKGVLLVADPCFDQRDLSGKRMARTVP